MATFISSGCKIRKNGADVALCKSPVNVASVLATRSSELNIRPDDDIDVVLWSTDSDGRTSESMLWTGCGWSTIDFYRSFGIR